MLKWFDAETFKELGAHQMGDHDIWGVVFSPDSKLVAVEGTFGANVLELESNEVIATAKGDGLGPSGGFVFSQDSRHLAFWVGSRTTGGPYHYISVWDVLQDKDLGDPFSEDGGFSTLMPERYHTMSYPTISPNGNLVAAGHSDKRVYVWNIQTGETQFLLEGHAGEVVSVDFSPNGRYLASGSRDGTVRLWNPYTGKLDRVITGLLDDICYVSFSSNGRLLEIGAPDQQAQVFNLDTGQLKPLGLITPTPDPFREEMVRQGFSDGARYHERRTLFSPDGTALAVASRNILLWDIASHELLTVLENPGGGEIRGLAFSYDGQKLAATTVQDEVLVWDIKTSQLQFTQKSDFLSGLTAFYASDESGAGPARGASTVAEQGLAFSSSGNLAFGNGNSIEIWDVDRASHITTLELNEWSAFPTNMSFSEDDDHLHVILNRNRSAQVWELESGQMVREVDLSGVNPDAFSAVALNGPRFARNNSDDQGSWIELWDLEEGECTKLATLFHETEPIRFSPDGSLLVAISGGRVSFWKTKTGQLVYQTKEDFRNAMLAISPDNRTLAVTREGKAELWNMDLIRAASLLEDLPEATPQPTATSWLSDFSTETPYPPAPFTPIPLPSLAAGAISPANAAQVVELARVGKGTIDQAGWTPDGQAITIAGSLGIFHYAPLTLTEIDHDEIHDWIYSAVLLLDGRWVAAGVGNEDRKVRVWDVVNSEILISLEGGGEPVLSPDGKRVVFLNEESNLQSWDIESDQPLATLRSWTFYSRWPVFSPDGELVAAIQASPWRLGSDDTVRMWDSRTGAVVNSLGGPDNDITDLSFSPDGRFLVGAAGGSAWIWDLRPGSDSLQIELYKGTVVDNLTIYEKTVTAAAINQSNSIVAMGTSENFIRLYYLNSKTVLHELRGHSNAIHHVRFSPDGRTLLSVDRDGSLMVWDVASGELLSALYAHTGVIGGLVFQADGNLISWMGGRAWRIRTRDGRLLGSTWLQSGKILGASPTEDWLAVYHPFRVSLWDARTAELWLTLEGEAEEPWVEYYWEGLVFRGFKGATFSRDGRRLATFGTGGVWVYDTQDGRLIRQFYGNDVRQAAFSYDGRWLVASLDALARDPEIFDLESGETLSRLETAYLDTQQIVFSPDNRWVGAVAKPQDESFQLILWDVKTANLEKALSFSEENPLISLAFNPDASLAAVGQADGVIFLVDLETMEVIRELHGQKAYADHLAFSSDGRYLTSGGIEGVVRIWGIREK
jgi:WD40 repeat protein